MAKHPIILYLYKALNVLCTGHPDLKLWHVRSQRNSLKYNVHYRGKNSIFAKTDNYVFFSIFKKICFYCVLLC